MKQSWNTKRPDDAQLQNRLLALGFPKLPVTETTRPILLNKLYTSAKRNDYLTPAPFKKPVVRQQISTYPGVSEAIKRTETVELPSENGCEYNSTLEADKKYQSQHAYLPCVMNRGKRLDKIYVTDADYPIRSSPDFKTFTSCTDQQSHLGVVNRLLSFRDKKFRKPNNSVIQLQSISKHSDKYFTKSKRTINEFISYISAQSRQNQSFKPYMLVGTFISFFISLAFIYVWRNPNNMKVVTIGSQVRVCDSEVSVTDCVPTDNVHNTIGLLEHMFKMFQSNSNKDYCITENIMVSETEFIEYITKFGFNNIKTLQKNLPYAKMLIEQNPQWKISIINGKDISYVMSTARSSLFCAFYTKIQSFFIIIGIGAVIAMGSGFFYVIYRYVRAWQINRSHIIQQFTTDIVNELIYRASLSENPKEREVIITHMRDKLIPLNKRKTYLKFWNEALHILEANDSRIQFGVIILDGEEYRIMKWLGDANSNKSSNGLFKKWQSPAFDYANKIVNPPTSCLKIRHMFDTTESNIYNLKQIIEAALIEKVGIRCGIKDIQIDKHTCCVYVRCNSEVDARIIHNEINGWWFDKRLISIKFLRLQRYLARFPNNETADKINH